MMYLHNRSWIVLWVVAVFATAGCGSSTQEQKQPEVPVNAKPATQVEAPRFQGDSALAHAATQVAFGPRTLGSKAHKACGDWLVSKLRSYNWEVSEQVASPKTPLGKLSIRNILAQYHPERTYRILLMAHWDTRPVADEDPDPNNHRKPIDGANDGASGVAVLLEIARLLQQQDPGIGVDIFLWDAEDLGQGDIEDSYALGAQYWANNPLPASYKADFGILLDMVGAKNALFPQEGFSKQYAPDVTDRVWRTAHRLGFGGYFLFYEEALSTLDDHYYINIIAQIPSIDIIQRDPQSREFFPHWHTLGDTMDKLSPETLHAVGQTVTTVLYEVGAEQRN